MPLWVNGTHEQGKSPPHAPPTGEARPRDPSPPPRTAQVKGPTEPRTNPLRRLVEVAMERL